VVARRVDCVLLAFTSDGRFTDLIRTRWVFLNGSTGGEGGGGGGGDGVGAGTRAVEMQQSSGRYSNALLLSSSSLRGSSGTRESSMNAICALKLPRGGNPELICSTERAFIGRTRKVISPTSLYNGCVAAKRADLGTLLRLLTVPPK